MGRQLSGRVLGVVLGVLLLGCGAEKELSATRWGRCVAKAVTLLDQAKPSEAVIALPPREDKTSRYADARETIVAAAAAGYRVVIIEREAEVAQATSSRSSKLIHGGLRYLETAQLGLVRECLRERALLLRLAGGRFFGALRGADGFIPAFSGLLAGAAIDGHRLSVMGEDFVALLDFLARARDRGRGRYYPAGQYRGAGQDQGCHSLGQGAVPFLRYRLQRAGRHPQRPGGGDTGRSGCPGEPGPQLHQGLLPVEDPIRSGPSDPAVAAQEKWPVRQGRRLRAGQLGRGV